MRKRRHNNRFEGIKWTQCMELLTAAALLLLLTVALIALVVLSLPISNGAPIIALNKTITVALLALAAITSIATIIVILIARRQAKDSYYGLFRLPYGCYISE